MLESEPCPRWPRAFEGLRAPIVWGVLAGIALQVGGCSMPAQDDPALLAEKLGVPVEPVPGEVAQFRVFALQGTVDYEKIGYVHLDRGYTVGVTLPSGIQVGFRHYEPMERLVELLERALGAHVEAIPGEDHQYAVYADRDGIDVEDVGDVSVDVGYAVGLRLRSGLQIGLQFRDPEIDPRRYSELLGAPVEAIPGEANQFVVHAARSSLDFSKLGVVHTDLGYAVGVQLESGSKVGFRIESPSASPGE